jgi:hypothetical protein
MRRRKNLTHVTKKAMKFRHARTHAKFSSSKVRIEKNFVLTKVQATYSY